MNIQLNIEPNKKYLLTVSGGIDSMVMADIFLREKKSFAVAHCNFSLRDEESDGDEILVRTWCEKNSIPFFTKKFDTNEFAKLHSLSIQEAARELRYTFFYELLNEYEFDFIATAHHQQDSIETTLFHFFSGTGLQGLIGIPETNHKIVRPLLYITKKVIQEYALEYQTEYRDDSSNSSSKYSRNFIRNKVLPLVEEHFPNVQQTLAQNIHRLKETDEIYSRSITQLTRKLIEPRGQDFYIPIRKLQHLTPLATITYELIKPFGFHFQQALELIDLMNSQTGSLIQNTGYKIIKNRNFFIITSAQSSLSEMIEIAKDDKCIKGQDFELEMKQISTQQIYHSTDASIELIDSSLLEYPLLLRKWKQGDYLYPLGMNKKKKVSRVLIDAKISLPDKERVWVLESNHKIIWILGIKLDNRFKISEQTTKIIELHYKKN